MTEPIAQILVGREEWLARFILRREHVRRDGTLKPDPFIPYRRVELSVTRHKDLTEDGVWAAGRLVATQVGGDLQGRGDIQADAFGTWRLNVQAAPTGENPNHANVVGWPADKQAQKEIAIELVRVVRFVRQPPLPA